VKPRKLLFFLTAKWTQPQKSFWNLLEQQAALKKNQDYGSLKNYSHQQSQTKDKN
jgi:hypothetical protein